MNEKKMHEKTVAFTDAGIEQVYCSEMDYVRHTMILSKASAWGLY